MFFCCLALRADMHALKPDLRKVLDLQPFLMDPLDPSTASKPIKIPRASKST